MFMLFFTDQRGRLRVTVIRMRMGRFRRFRADQFTPFHGVAFVRMGMSLRRLRIAAFRMLVDPDLRQWAPERPAFVIAGRIMLVNHKVRIPAAQIPFAVIAGIIMLVEIQRLLIADRHCLFHRQHLGIAFLGMGVFRNLTGSLFHGDGREDQCINRAEHHHAGKTGHNPAPARSLLFSCRIFPCPLFHAAISCLSIAMRQIRSAARPGTRSFPRSVPLPHSPQQNGGNPPM